MTANPPSQPGQTDLQRQRATRSPLSHPVTSLWEAAAQLQSICKRAQALATLIDEQSDDLTLCDDARSQAVVFAGFASFWHHQLAARAIAILHQSEEARE